MRCPKCGSTRSEVTNTRADDTSIRRRRECLSCNSRFTTYERVEMASPMVVKKDGRREPFDRGKVKGGLIRACEKTQVSMEQIDKAVDSIESKINESSAKEIPSRSIGDYVMESLRELDKVAYVRFASVYREFSDVSQFVDTLRSLNEKASKREMKAAARRKHG